MNRTILALMMLCALAACKKTKESDLKKDIDEIPKVEISVSALRETGSGSDPEGDVTYNLLGYGYDITDKYASKESVRSQVIDVHSLVSNNNSEVFSTDNSTHGFSMRINGINAEDLSGKFSDIYDETKGLNVFKATIMSSFPENDALSKKYGYGYFSSIFVRRRLRIEAVKGSNSLTSGFTQDVNNLSVERLVKKYGTHILQRIQIGTRINAIYQAELPDNSTRKLAVREGLDYTIKNVFGFLPENGDPLDIKALNTNSSVKLKYEFIGGDPRQIKELDFKGKKVIDHNDWYKSISETNYRFIDFDKNGLIPLYDLIIDNAKKAVVKDFVTKYISENQVK